MATLRLFPEGILRSEALTWGGDGVRMKVKGTGRTHGKTGFTWV